MVRRGSGACSCPESPSVALRSLNDNSTLGWRAGNETAVGGPTDRAKLPGRFGRRPAGRIPVPWLGFLDSWTSRTNSYHHRTGKGIPNYPSPNAPSQAEERTEADPAGRVSFSELFGGRT